MYKADFYIVCITSRDQFNRPIKKKYFRKVSGCGETFEAPDGSIIEIRIDKRREGDILPKSAGGTPEPSKHLQTVSEPKNIDF